MVRWSTLEKTWHINVLKLKAVRIPILSFTKFKKLNSIHLCIDNMIALSYLLNMGGTQNSEQTFNQNLKRNVIAEYRPSLSNQTGD